MKPPERICNRCKLEVNKEGHADSASLFPVRQEVSQTLNKYFKMTEQIVFDVYNDEGNRLNQSALTQEEVTNFVQQLQESKVDAKFSIRSHPARGCIGRS